MEFGHDPYRRIRAGKTVSKGCVENRRKSCNELVRTPNDCANGSIGRIAQYMMGRIGPVEAMVEVDDAASPGNNAVPHSRPYLGRCDEPGALRRRLGVWPADLDDVPDRSPYPIHGV